MIRNSAPTIQVELTTHEGVVFSGMANSAELSHASGTVQIEPDGTDYFGCIEEGEITLHIGNDFRFFRLRAASASVKERRLTVVAEVIQATVSASGFPVDVKVA